jgi:hypothetical protein
MKFDNFDLYVERKVDPDNDYKILDPSLGKHGMMVPTNNTPFTEEEDALCNIRPLISKKEIAKRRKEAEENGGMFNIPGVRVMKKELIDRYHPDNVDVNRFWELATKFFPNFSIAGGQSGCKTPDHCNQVTLHMAWEHGPLSEFDEYLTNDVQDIGGKVLEIGPGYGGVCHWLKEHFPTVDYYGIDVNPLFVWPQLYKVDGKTIPNEIPDNLDAVYSYNVFQHLSKSQRTSYYKQVWEKLKEGGKFYFGMFLWTEKNKDWSVWGIKDFKGRYYCSFFKQYTQIDREYEIHAELKEIGFEVKDVTKHPDKTNAHAFECTKINR